MTDKLKIVVQRTVLQQTITNLRRLRDTKPELWDAIVDSELCNCWDSIKEALGDDDPKKIQLRDEDHQRRVKEVTDLIDDTARKMDMNWYLYR